jgi:hypothetical protein
MCHPPRYRVSPGLFLGPEQWPGVCVTCLSMFQDLQHLKDDLFCMATPAKTLSKIQTSDGLRAPASHRESTRLLKSEKTQIPPDLVVDSWASSVESHSTVDFLYVPDA